eukprot:gb/GECG01013786.1/.p1 GENE.gb/GECG01013786.1/~~gb/GECG01013786.1/.p1  ORF type:complete len:583 (+),score=68.82 gb/GECG01013786.1/:1-1749(+)
MSRDGGGGVPFGRQALRIRSVMNADDIYSLTEDEKNLFVLDSSLEDNYELREELGSGAFGAIRAAVDRRTGTEVAVKIMKQRLLRYNSRLVRVILDEVKVMKHLADTMGQTGVLSLIEAFYDQGRVAVVMPKCTGGDLFDRIVELAETNDKYTEQDCARLFNILFQLVSSVHKNAKLLHNDLKHEHFMLQYPDNESKFLIADFGYASHLPASGINGELKGTKPSGTHAYMAPEIFERFVYSVKSEAWAMGVALYIALKARFPFQPSQIKDYGLKAIKTSAASIHRGTDLAGLSEDAADLIRKLLELDPEKRYDAEDALDHPFLKRWRAQNSADLDLIPQLERFRVRHKFRCACRAVEAGSYMNRCALLKAIILNNAPENSEIPSIQVDRIRQMFSRHCKWTRQPTSGRWQMLVSLEAFKKVMTDLELQHLPLERMFAVFDSNGDGVVDFQEFLCGLTLLNGVNMETLRCCFDIFDHDGNGVLDPNELMNILELVATGDEVTDEALVMNLQVMMDEIDIDGMYPDRDFQVVPKKNHSNAAGDGYITFEEFRKGVRKFPVLANALLGEVQGALSATEQHLFGSG